MSSIEYWGMAARRCRRVRSFFGKRWTAALTIGRRAETLRRGPHREARIATSRIGIPRTALAARRFDTVRIAQIRRPQLGSAKTSPFGSTLAGIQRTTRHLLP